MFNAKYRLAANKDPASGVSHEDVPGVPSTGLMTTGSLPVPYP